MPDLDAFLRSYIETAIWFSCDDHGEACPPPMDDNYSADDLAPEALTKMADDCGKFLGKALALIDADDPRFNSANGTRYEHAAHDFWLTRNHHGAGFWDGDWPKHGDDLTKIAQEFPEETLYVGDDGKIYLM